MEDDDLRRSVSDELFSDPKITIDAAIDVSVEDGEVTLRGTVVSFGDKREAKDAAQRVSTGTGVKDQPEPCQASGDAGMSSITRNTTGFVPPG